MINTTKTQVFYWAKAFSKHKNHQNSNHMYATWNALKRRTGFTTCGSLCQICVEALIFLASKCLWPLFSKNTSYNVLLLWKSSQSCFYISSQKYQQGGKPSEVAGPLPWHIWHSPKSGRAKMPLRLFELSKTLTALSLLSGKPLGYSWNNVVVAFINANMASTFSRSLKTEMYRNLLYLALQ